MLSISSGVRISSKSDMSDKDKSSIVASRSVVLSVSEVRIRLLRSMVFLTGDDTKLCFDGVPICSAVLMIGWWAGTKTV